MYCDSINSKKRKNCIIVLNVILESLLKWFAPILVFTTEEIYSLVNKNNSESIHENNFVRIPNNWKNDKLNEKWSNLFKIKQNANIAIEEKRANKEIGSSLEADLNIHLDKKLKEITKNIDFSELCITSKAEISFKENLESSVKTTKAKGTKCTLCWKIIENACERNHCPQNT